MGDGLHFSLQQCGSITQLPPIGLHSEPLPPTLPSLAMGEIGGLNTGCCTSSREADQTQ